MFRFYKALTVFLVLLSGLAAAQPQHRITLNPALRPFYHGVESGDPTENSVMIWTRVTPDSGTSGSIEVNWQIATDVNFTNVVNYGRLSATEENHFCVKQDVCGLQPSTFYYYMFQSGGRNSVIGRTKTAPDATADNDSVRFAVVSCASWEHGYFNAYESISHRNDVDAVLHLGDYIYEYASGDFSSNISGRTYDPPTEAYTELGYQLRYSQYKLDDQLRRIHQLYPFITVWDDHETANDAWREGAQNHTQGAEGYYLDRKHYSTSEYFKWMPLRKPDPLDTIRIFRKLRYGKLLDLIMLDTRLYDRDEQNLTLRNDSTRHMMGPVERAWFLSQLSDTSTRWKIIGNQVMFAPLELFGQPVNADQWDGYNYERTLIQNHIMNNNINDVVILTGDIHTSWCNDVPGPNYNPSTGAGAVCVEFVGSSVTSLNSPLPVGSSIIRSLNPHMKYINLDDKGYYVLDVRKGKTQADYTYMSRVDQIGATDIEGPHYSVNHLQRHLNEETNAVYAPAITAANPPLLPNQSLPIVKIEDHYLNVEDNTQTSVLVVPNVSVCPAKTLSVISHGAGAALSFDGHTVTYVSPDGYSGTDTTTLIVCNAPNNAVCDTYYLYITVTNLIAADTLYLSTPADSSISECLHFDDVVSENITIAQQASNGTLTLTDSCFTYLPANNFTGSDIFSFIRCDSSNVCDTILCYITVGSSYHASTQTFTITKNSNKQLCPYFDEVRCAAHWQITRAPQNGTIQSNNTDSCLRYFPYFNFTGYDSIRLIACDTCGLQLCDTLNVLFDVEDPNALPLNPKPVVLGIFPNPANDVVVVQYYLYKNSSLAISLFDESGKLIQRGNKKETPAGLGEHAINLNGISQGVYLLKIETREGGYTRQLIKQ